MQQLRKSMTNGSKTGPNTGLKSRKIKKKGITKIDAKIDAKKGRFRNLRQHRTGSAFDILKSILWANQKSIF